MTSLEEKAAQPDAEVAQSGEASAAQSTQAQPAAIREDQVVNAVAFLSHPKVLAWILRDFREIIWS
jgi:hypothetical protein